MPWNQPGGGGGGGPWGSGGGGAQPPDLEEILRRGQERFRRAMPGSVGSGRGIIFIGGAKQIPAGLPYRPQLTRRAPKCAMPQ